MARLQAAAAAANVLLCCVVLLGAITLKGACAKTVLFNKSGRDLVLILRQADDGKIEVPAGKSIELEGVQQQRGVMIRDVQSGTVAGPLDLPDHQAVEVRWLGHTFAAMAAGNPLSASKLLDFGLGVGNLLNARGHIP